MPCGATTNASWLVTSIPEGRFGVVAVDVADLIGEAAKPYAEFIGSTLLEPG